MVAPPAHKDWPVMSEGKKARRRRIKKDLVGMAPADVSHKGDASGNKASREER